MSRHRSSSVSSTNPSKKVSNFLAKSKAKMTALLSPKIRSESPPHTLLTRGRGHRPHSKSVDSLSHREFVVNDVVMNRYVLNRKITTMDACQVFGATDLVTQQKVTVKIYPRTSQVQKEIELSQMLAPDGDTRGILHVQSSYDLAGMDCIVVVAGPFHGSLNEFMGWSVTRTHEHSQHTMHRFVSEKLLRNLAQQIAGGLKKIHEHGWLHGSIRPENILVRVVSQPDLNFHHDDETEDIPEEKAAAVAVEEDEGNNRMMQLVQSLSISAPEDGGLASFSTPSPRSRAVTSLGQLFETISLDNIAESNMDVLAWVGNLGSAVSANGRQGLGLNEIARCHGRLCMTAPEVLGGDAAKLAEDEGKSDVFSLGCILWKCVYGVAPYGIRGDFDPIGNSWENWRYTPLKAPAMDSRRISPQLRNLLLGMLELSVEARSSLDEVVAHDWMR